MRSLLFFGLLLVVALTRPAAGIKDVCQAFCDGEDSNIAIQVRNVTVHSIRGRTLTLSVTDAMDMAFAVLENGQPGDELWLDRSFDAGNNWEPDGTLLGFLRVENGQSTARTSLYNVDDTSVLHGIGAIRACTHVMEAEPNLICTEWGRSKYLAETPIKATATALMQYYKEDGLWQTVGWWNGANCLTAMIGYLARSGDQQYMNVIEESYWKNLDGWWGNFTSDALDDVAWWALAWIDAYDLTGNQTYLDMAILDAEHIVAYRDDVCGDGIWWNIYRKYKNAITNELYIKLAAQLHNRIPGDTKYLQEAVELWDWFINRSGMMNDEYLINDGLVFETCESNHDTTWTYNQGVILGAAAELAEATGDPQYLDTARKIADAVISKLSPGGILQEPCENWPESCNWDQASFKGIYVRNLAMVNRALPEKPYQAYLEAQVKSNYENNRTPFMDQYGLRFSGPFDYPDANRQHCVLDAYNAALP